MPIYEFYCPDCHRVFSFLSRAVDTRRQPACPKCARPELARRPSSFAISKGRPEPAPAGEAEGAEGPDPFAGVDEARLERAMEQLASEADGMSEDDPRAQARLMRRLFDAAGLPVQGGMQEALRRLEAGEDPEAVEAELGDALEGAGAEPFVGASPRRTLSRLRLRLPPSVDPTLYEL
jgi:putative FmdB family regulatory protein